MRGRGLFGGQSYTSPTRNGVLHQHWIPIIGNDHPEDYPGSTNYNVYQTPSRHGC